MSYEVHRVANGYLLMPVRSYEKNGCNLFSEMYVFESYQRMVDKLHEILEEKKHVQS